MIIKKLQDSIGAEVIGLDMRHANDIKTRKLLNDAVVEHIALVIRNQK